MKTYCLGFEALDEDAVKERDDGLDGPESCLGSLWNEFSFDVKKEKSKQACH
jgi:hypothetical protein